MSVENKKCFLSLFIGGTVLTSNDNVVGEY